MKKKYIYNPDMVSPPGATLLDILEERNINLLLLWGASNLSIELLNDVADGKTPITEDIAKELERLLDVPAEFWLQREKHYRHWIHSRSKSMEK